MTMMWFWLLIAGVMLVVELATTALVSLWFVAGALCAALAAYAGFPWWGQAILFGGVSAMLFVLCRKWLLAHFQTRRLPTNTSRLLHETGIVTVPIQGAQGGRVQVLGQDWKAVSLGQTPILQGTEVRIVGISGVKLEVVPAALPSPLQQTAIH